MRERKREEDEKNERRDDRKGRGQGHFGRPTMCRMAVNVQNIVVYKACVVVISMSIFIKFEI